MPTADQVNERIRALMLRTSGRPLWPEEAAEYERLVEQWWKASGRGVAQAA